MKKKLYDVVLIDHGGKKLGVVKAVMDATGLGLKNSKDLVDAGEGSIILKGVDSDEALNAQEMMEEAGAYVKVVEHLKEIIFNSDPFGVEAISQEINKQILDTVLKIGTASATTGQISFKVLDNGSILKTSGSNDTFSSSIFNSYRINYRTKSGEDKTEIVFATTLEEAKTKLPDLESVNYHMGG